jgi:hypothetical protein
MFHENGDNVNDSPSIAQSSTAYHNLEKEHPRLDACGFGWLWGKGNEKDRRAMEVAVWGESDFILTTLKD